MNKKIKFRFLVASDGHFGEPGVSSDDNYRNFTRWLIKEKQEKGLDLFIFNGDLVHDRPEDLPLVKSYFDQAGIDYFVIRGNHDMVSEDQWRDIFRMEIDFIRNIKNIVFLSCRTSNDSGEYLCADIHWLKENIEANRSYKHIFIFLHISQGGWTEHGINCPEVIELLDNYPQISAVFFGHDHQENHMRVSQHTKYFFDGYIGGSWGGNNIGYRIVEIDVNEGILTYQYDPVKKIILNQDPI